MYVRLCVRVCVWSQANKKLQILHQLTSMRRDQWHLRWGCSCSVLKFSLKVHHFVSRSPLVVFTFSPLGDQATSVTNKTSVGITHSFTNTDKSASCIAPWSINALQLKIKREVLSYFPPQNLTPLPENVCTLNTFHSVVNLRVFCRKFTGFRFENG